MNDHNWEGIEIELLEEELIDFGLIIDDVYESILVDHNYSGGVLIGEYQASWMQSSQHLFEIKVCKTGGSFVKWEDLLLSALSRPGAERARHTVEKRVELLPAGSASSSSTWVGKFSCIRFFINLAKAHNEESDRLSFYDFDDAPVCRPEEV